jgi:hypothetical protein
MIALLLLVPTIFFGWFVFAILSSPGGYEDKDGFHRSRSKLDELSTANLK